MQHSTSAPRASIAAAVSGSTGTPCETPHELATAPLPCAPAALPSSPAVSVTVTAAGPVTARPTRTPLNDAERGAAAAAGAGTHEGGACCAARSAGLEAVLT